MVWPNKKKERNWFIWIFGILTLALLTLVVLKTGYSQRNNKSTGVNSTHNPVPPNVSNLTVNQTKSVTTTTAVPSLSNSPVVTDMHSTSGQKSFQFESNYYRLITVSFSNNAKLKEKIKFSEKLTLSITNVPGSIVHGSIKNSEFPFNLGNVTEKNYNQTDFVVRMCPDFDQKKGNWKLIFNFKSAAELNEKTCKSFKISPLNSSKNHSFSVKYSELMQCTNEFKERSKKEIPQSYLPIEFIVNHFVKIIDQCSKKKEGEEKRIINTLSSTKKESLN